MSDKSCLDCQHCNTWHYPATWEDPEDSVLDCDKGWPYKLTDDECGALANAGHSQDRLCEVIADHCPSFEVKQPYVSKVSRSTLDLV